MAVDRCLAQENGEPASRWTVQVLHTIGQPDRAQTGVIKNVLLRNNGRQALTCGVDGVTCLWDIESRRIIRRFADEGSSAVYCMALVQSDSQLLTGGDGDGIALWDVETGKRIRRFDYSSRVFSIVVLQDGQSFLFGDAQGNVVHQSLDGQTRHGEYRDDTEDITALVLNPRESGFVTGNGDGVVAAWEFDQSAPAARYAGLNHWVCCLRYSADGRELFGCDYNGNVALWDTETNKLIWNREKLSGEICWGHFLNDQTLVVVDADDAFYLLDRKTGEEQRQEIALPAAAGFALSPDKQVIWSGGHHVLCGWNSESGERVFPDEETMQMPAGADAVAMRGDMVYAASQSPSLSAWNAKTGERVFQIVPETDLEDNLHLTPTPRGLLMTGEAGALMVDYETGDGLSKFEFNCTAASVLPDGKTAVFLADDNHSAFRTNLETGDQQLLFENEEEYFRDLQAIDQHHFMVANSDRTFLQVRSTVNGEVVGSATLESEIEFGDAHSHAVIGVNDERGIFVFSPPKFDDSLPADDEFQQLISDLNAPRFDMREQATRRLMMGGAEIERQLGSLQPRSVETRVRIAKILAGISTARLPDLNRPLDSLEPVDEPVDATCLDRLGRFFLVAVRKGWKSDLLVCEIGTDDYAIRHRMPLRSRAVQIRPAAERLDTFVIGFADGTLDIIQVQASQSISR